MSFINYTIFDEESDEETRYSSFVDLEAFEESDEDAPEGFDGTEKGLALEPGREDRSRVSPWVPCENFFSFI
jgi:hypothetical protein